MEDFFEEGFLIRNASKLKHLPISIVQGRYDVVCPAYTAWDLRSELGGDGNKLLDFDFVITGHSAKETLIEDKLIRATEKFKSILRK